MHFFYLYAIEAYRGKSSLKSYEERGWRRRRMGGGYTHNVPLSLECPYQHMELLETIVILLSPEEYGEPIAYISLYLMWIRFFFSGE